MTTIATTAGVLLTETDQKKIALKVLMAVAETIREVGEAPSGTIYAALMSHGCTMSQYEAIIGTLTRAGLVRETSAHLLVWIGGDKIL